MNAKTNVTNALITDARHYAHDMQRYMGQVTQMAGFWFPAHRQEFLAAVKAGPDAAEAAVRKLI